MLYILPPPSAKPPSVWDLIINFHRKGCQEANGSSSNPKKLLKFDCRETTKKSQRTWCKKSPSDQSLHVSIYRARPVVDLKKCGAIVISFTFSRARLQTHGHIEKISLNFHPKQDFWFPSHRRRRRHYPRDVEGNEKFSPSPHTWQNSLAAFKNSFFLPFRLKCEKILRTKQKVFKDENSSQIEISMQLFSFLLFVCKFFPES